MKLRHQLSAGAFVALVLIVAGQQVGVPAQLTASAGSPRACLQGGGLPRLFSSPLGGDWGYVCDQPGDEDLDVHFFDPEGVPEPQDKSFRGGLPAPNGGGGRGDRQQDDSSSSIPFSITPVPSAPRGGSTDTFDRLGLSDPANPKGAAPTPPGQGRNPQPNRPVELFDENNRVIMGNDNPNQLPGDRIGISNSSVTNSLPGDRIGLTNSSNANSLPGDRIGIGNSSRPQSLPGDCVGVPGSCPNPKPIPTSSAAPLSSSSSSSSADSGGSSSSSSGGSSESSAGSSATAINRLCVNFDGQRDVLDTWTTQLTAAQRAPLKEAVSRTLSIRGTEVMLSVRQADPRPDAGPTYIMGVYIDTAHRYDVVVSFYAQVPEVCQEVMFQAIAPASQRPR